MTQKEFKNAMGRGLGRCILAVKKDPERYRELVMWACGNNLCFDAQCEGNRSWYVLQMVRQYPDIRPFAEVAAEALGQCDLRDDWRLNHLCALLTGFAGEGDSTAKRALEEKYRALRKLLETLQTRSGPVFYERDALARLCVTLAVSEGACLKIAEDLGRLYLTKSDLKDGDFEWVYDTVTDRCGSALREAARSSPEIACFIAREEAWRKIWETRTREKTDHDQMGARRRSMYLKVEGDRETIGRYAEAYRRTMDPKERAEALMSFCCCPYPDDPAPILTDAKSPEEELSWAALLALNNICDPAVREFALAEIEKDGQGYVFLPMLTRNYRPEDVPILEMLLERALAGDDSDRLHSVQWEILKLFDRRDEALKHLLPGIYETIPCACCRRRVVAQLNEYGMLTRDILAECLYDSDDDTRQFAFRRIKRT